MDIFKNIKSFFGASPGGCASSTIVTIDQFTSNLLYTSTYAQLAREGFIENAISHTCIKRIAEEVAHLPFEVLIDEKNINDINNPVARSLKELLKNPNSDYDWPSFIEGVMTYKPIDGRAYIWPQMSDGGMPMMIEPLVFRPNEEAGGYMVDGDDVKIMHLLRQAVELGADIIKADPTDDVSLYHKVVEAAGGVPVLVRGGGRVPDRELFERTVGLVNQGVHGIVYGRNVIQHESPAGITRALMAILHDDADVEQAEAILAKEITKS